MKTGDTGDIRIREDTPMSKMHNLHALRVYLAQALTGTAGASC
jgi:hypothetical protein